MATDWDFVFDGVFGFLTSQIWQIPVMDFIEGQCEVFDPSGENCASWSEHHGKYRNLVENLLSSYLKDVGITEEQFVKACSTPAAQERPQMQVIFEQIWAAEDFEIFKRMMVQRNIELQLQALQMIQQRQGIKSQNQLVQQTMPTDEDEILNAVLRQSKEEYERSQKGKTKDDSKFNAELEQALAKSEEDAKRLKEAIEKQNEEKKEAVKATLASETPPPVKEAPKPKQVEQEKKVVPAKAKTPEPLKPLEPIKSTPPVKQTDKPKSPSKVEKKPEPVKSKTPSPKKEAPRTSEPQSSTDAAAAWLKSAKEDATLSASTTSQTSTQHSEDEMKRREEYLKQQRDRLLALKKNEREKRLNTFTQSQPKRPASARAAREAVKETSVAAPAKSVTLDDPKKLAMRRALAERLKKEVIDKQDD